MPPTSGKVSTFLGMPIVIAVCLGRGKGHSTYNIIADLPVLYCTGHDGTVLSTSWNHGGEWLLTCSADKTARVWSSGHKDPVLTISTLRHNFNSTKDMKVSKI